MREEAAASALGQGCPHILSPVWGTTQSAGSSLCTNTPNSSSSRGTTWQARGQASLLQASARPSSQRCVREGAGEELLRTHEGPPKEADPAPTVHPPPPQRRPKPSALLPQHLQAQTFKLSIFFWLILNQVYFFPFILF